MRMDNGQAYRQAAQVLPLSLRSAALTLPEDKQGRAEELRLRIGHPVTVVFPQGELPLGTNPVTGRYLEHLLELASRASVHTVADQLRRGYLTVEGGHRVGLCGTPAGRPDPRPGAAVLGGHPGGSAGNRSGGAGSTKVAGTEWSVL